MPDAQRVVEMDQPASVAERVRLFLADRFLFDPDATIDPGASLIGSGILDSTGAMELVFFIEEQFGVEVADQELVPDNLDSIAKVAAFIARKSRAA